MRIEPAVTVGDRVRLLIAKFGLRTCRHDYRLVQTRTRLFLRCLHCSQETEGFEIAGGVRHDGPRC